MISQATQYLRYFWCQGLAREVIDNVGKKSPIVFFTFHFKKKHDHILERVLNDGEKTFLILSGVSADMLNCQHLLNDQNLSL